MQVVYQCTRCYSTVYSRHYTSVSQKTPFAGGGLRAMRCALDVISLSNVVATAILATPRKAAGGNQPGRPASGDGRALPSGDG